MCFAFFRVFWGVLQFATYIYICSIGVAFLDFRVWPQGRGGEHTQPQKKQFDYNFLLLLT